MSFIKESKDAYKKVIEALEKETSDHEISMARGELETIADRALATSAMLEGTPENGNPLPAWVQSKITNACDYITTVHDYLKYSPKLNESVSLDETTFEKIYQMQQDGKSVEDIAKELNLKSDLVKKVLGESKTISEGLSDAQIAQLKKEYEPLKGKTITTSQYQQLKNILFKLQDGDLEKLQKQNIPFASTGAGSILRVRKAPVKITNVTVPGLEGMAEATDMSKVTKYKMVSIKGDQKEITIDREDLEKHLKLGYVIKEPLTEETTFWWHDGKTGYVKAGYDNKELVAWLKKNGYKPEKKEEVEFTEESDKGYNVKYKMKKDDASISMSWYKDKELAQKFLDDVKKSGGNGIITAKEEKDPMPLPDLLKLINKEKEKIAKEKQQDSNKKEEAELKTVPSLEDSAKKHNVDIEVLKKQLEKGIKIEKEHTNDEKTAEKIALAHIDERPDYYIQIDKLEKKPVEKVNEVKEPTGELKDACWTGYVAVGFKMKNGKRVPNCVPKSEAYKGAKKIVEKAFKKLKEKK